MNRFPSTAAVMLVLVLAVASAGAQRQNSSRKKLKPAIQTTETHSELYDTIAVDDSCAVRFSGYEKTLRSPRETVFITNNGALEISRIIFSISYFDAQKRLLHKTRKNIAATVPPGETRRIDFPSWDKQCTFYYHDSPRPRVPAIPYSVKIAADSITVIKADLEKHRQNHTESNGIQQHTPTPH